MEPKTLMWEHDTGWGIKAAVYAIPCPYTGDHYSLEIQMDGEAIMRDGPDKNKNRMIRGGFEKITQIAVMMIGDAALARAKMNEAGTTH